ncbi:MAG: bifunctional DNA-formamidopyrimidine glycosylase/DNA-(apurinic or apyrimidinic site) lyase [Clostridia bacterium]|nr:bifunctional DNA-formamidopyrimidine glycosylase/DNA-(apurinic or apyrimidinic site) lyase [Clostridia bacterium]
MPELPEVKTIINVLKPYIVGRTITGVIVNNNSVIARPLPSGFAECLNGKTFSDISRRGKFLRFHFTGGDTLVLHLRMTGCLTVEDKTAPQDKHTHLVFTFDDGKELRYEDIRRFGRFWYIEKGIKDSFSGIDKLGVEPTDISFDYLKSKFSGSGKTIKELLLEQSIIAGIGNIYSDEICFRAKLLSDKKGKTLTDDELSRLCSAIPETITYFVKQNQISFEDYLNTKGKEYRNTPFLQVYGRSKQPCPICNTILVGKTIGGRSCVYCPNCQN